MPTMAGAFFLFSGKEFQLCTEVVTLRKNLLFCAEVVSLEKWFLFCAKVVTEVSILLLRCKMSSANWKRPHFARWLYGLRKGFHFAQMLL